MPRMLGQQLESDFRVNSEAVAGYLASVLRGMGYSNATNENVEREVDSLLQGKEPEGTGYGVWLQYWLKNGIDVEISEPF